MTVIHVTFPDHRGHGRRPFRCEPAPVVDLRQCGNCQHGMSAGWLEPCASCVPVLNSRWTPHAVLAWELWAHSPSRSGPVFVPAHPPTGKCVPCNASGKVREQIDGVDCPWCKGSGTAEGSI